MEIFFFALYERNENLLTSTGKSKSERENVPLS